MSECSGRWSRHVEQKTGPLLALLVSVITPRVADVGYELSHFHLFPKCPSTSIGKGMDVRSLLQNLHLGIHSQPPLHLLARLVVVDVIPIVSAHLLQSI